MAQTENRTLSQRLDALKAPSRRLDTYGNHECGCTWDSGPIGVFCKDHDADTLVWDALRELHAAATDRYTSIGLTRLDAALEAVERILTEGVEPAT